MRILKFLILFLKFVFKFNEFKKLQSSDIILIGNDHDRSLSFFDKKYSQILDSIDFFLCENGLESLHIASPISKSSGKKTHGNAISLNGKYIRAKILQKIYDLFFIKRKDPIVNLWVDVINVVNPRFIIGIQPSPELCIAAKKKGVIIFDYQHGVLSNEGYYGHNYRNKFDNEGWPNCILTWNQGSSEWAKKNISNEVVPILLGNPWFLRFSEPNSKDSLVSYYLLNSYTSTNSYNILISLQWGYSNNNSFLGIPLNLFNYMKSNGDNYNWFIRIHPIMLNDSNILHDFELTFRGYKNVEWINSSVTPLPLVLKNIHLHFTSHSALTIEASWYGIKTGLLLNNVELLSEYFSEQINSGLADIISDKFLEIDNWISFNLNQNKIHNVDYVSSTKPLENFIMNLKSNNFNI